MLASKHKRAASWKDPDLSHVLGLGRSSCISLSPSPQSLLQDHQQPKESFFGFPPPDPKLSLRPVPPSAGPGPHPAPVLQPGKSLPLFTELLPSMPRPWTTTLALPSSKLRSLGESLPLGELPALDESPPLGLSQLHGDSLAPSKSLAKPPSVSVSSAPIQIFFIRLHRPSSCCLSSLPVFF